MAVLATCDLVLIHLVSFPDPTFLESGSDQILVLLTQQSLISDAPIRIAACDFSCDMKQVSLQSN